MMIHVICFLFTILVSDGDRFVVRDTTPHQNTCIGIGWVKDASVNSNDSQLISMIVPVLIQTLSKETPRFSSLLLLSSYFSFS